MQYIGLALLAVIGLVEFVLKMVLALLLGLLMLIPLLMVIDDHAHLLEPTLLKAVAKRIS